MLNKQTDTKPDAQSSSFHRHSRQRAARSQPEDAGTPRSPGSLPRAFPSLKGLQEPCEARPEPEESPDPLSKLGAPLPARPFPIFTLSSRSGSVRKWLALKGAGIGAVSRVL